MIHKLKFLVIAICVICLVNPVALGDFYKDDGVTYPIIRHIGLVTPDIIEIEIDEGRYEGGQD